MSTSPPPITLHTKPLRYSLTQKAYELYRAALEWELADPILINDRKDLKSEPKWRDQIEPFHHQVKNLISFCRRLPVTLLADDVGLGKTISAGLIASELISRGRVRKILVVCPKLLLPQWKEELESKFRITTIPVIGKELLSAKLPDDSGALVTTYNSARLYLDRIADAGFDMVVLDEAHKLRNLYGVEQAPKVAERFRKALADRMFKYVLMLTATPIQNRLWDVYSLVELLTIARGHENPFGVPGTFARNYIADDPDKARRLNPEKRDEFRSIVYRYMSRVRRGDANLHFPERVVQLHKVEPSAEELELIRIVGLGIAKLNYLSQISILRALISSPHALNTQLRHMAENGTVPRDLAIQVNEIVQRGNVTAKLLGLATLVDRLRAENPQHWRMVVFTTMRETQTTIESFLRERGIPCGLINGDSSKRNQSTIAKFVKTVPELNVIVSTEAGAEGVNLQAANVLVNFDLPWNPMIVEQRIGRIQRLASKHESVCIFNIILKGTFEEYIVGRLMEKLQMASHAIGDLEALLSASGLSDHEEDATVAFEEKIRQLVVSSLAGADTDAAVKLAAKSIADAKVELESQEKDIDALFGDTTSDAADITPADLPPIVRTKSFQAFVLEALSSLGTRLTERSPGLYAATDAGRNFAITFNESDALRNGAVFYGPGTAAFGRLSNRITAQGGHRVVDVDDQPAAKADSVAKSWVESFGAKFVNSQVSGAARSFAGSALLRVRATVAHDSYERLIETDCEGGKNWSPPSAAYLGPVSETLTDLASLGVSSDSLVEDARDDRGIAEFCRFYGERRSQEVACAGADTRKAKKIEDEFTPRVDATAVGLQGALLRQLSVKVVYEPEPGEQYQSDLKIVPSKNQITQAPEIVPYEGGKTAPIDALARCAISNRCDLRHKFVRSDSSGRIALPQYSGECSVSGETALADELGKSDLSGKLVKRSLLKTSAVSGKSGEPSYFDRCEITSADVLKSELFTSQISQKKFRCDEQMASVVSGRKGHKSEFVYATDSQDCLLPTEAATCEVTHKVVRSGTLEKCEVTGKMVIPSELEKCVVTRRRALRSLFVSSSISGGRVLETEALRSDTGNYCLPNEAKPCFWSGKDCHPDDLRICQLTGLSAHFKFMTTSGGTCLEPLVNLLRGVTRRTDVESAWDTVSLHASRLSKGKVKIESSECSPSGRHLAVCGSTRNWLGRNIRHLGMIYVLGEKLLVGRIVSGRRTPTGWRLEQTI